MGLSAEYAAGFFDGEGYVSILAPSRGTPSWRMMAAVGQNDPRPLWQMQERWGGTVRPFKKPNGVVHYQWRIALEFDARIGRHGPGEPGRKGLGAEEHEAREELRQGLKLVHARRERWSA